MEEEFVLQTAQHGFKPSGIVAASESDAGERRNSTELTAETKMHRLCGRESSGEAEIFFLSQFDLKENRYDFKLVTRTTKMKRNLDCFSLWPVFSH